MEAVLRVMFLGTASACPTVSRNVSGLAVSRKGRHFLFDCGEGTQRQMMKYGVGFSAGDILITHLHADHYLGIPGLLRTLTLQGRQQPITLWGPSGSSSVLRDARDLGGDRLSFDVPVRELGPGDAIEGDGFRIEAFETDHGKVSVGFALVEEDRSGRFNVELARELGVPEGPLFARLHSGEDVVLDDGRKIESAELVGPRRPGRRVVYTGDTAPCDRVAEVAVGADLLIHEATFGSSDRRRARETRHSTGAQAARLALRAGVKDLVLTHISARQRGARDLLAEARAVFPRARLARDGLEIQVGLDDEENQTTDAHARDRATGGGAAGASPVQEAGDQADVRTRQRPGLLGRLGGRLGAGH